MATLADAAIPILTLAVLATLSYLQWRSSRRLRDVELTAARLYQAAGVDPDDIHRALGGEPVHECPFVFGLNGVGVLSVRLPKIAIVRGGSELEVIDSRDESFSVKFWALRSRIVIRWAGKAQRDSIAAAVASVDFERLRVLMSDR